jgi:TM2 domain-containing membrane protein YozV
MERFLGNMGELRLSLGECLDMEQSGTTSERKTKFCVNCGAEIDARAEICPKCGVRIAPPPPSATPTALVARKNEGIAAVLSFLFVGLGQIYNGEIGKGIMFLIIGIILVFTMIFLIGFILYPLFWIYNIYDAYNTAKRINAGLITT